MPGWPRSGGSSPGGPVSWPTEATAGERPAVIGRGHPSWAEVDAEQRERLGDPPGEDGQP